jgi:hypothetical protein
MVFIMVMHQTLFRRIVQEESPIGEGAIVQIALVVMVIKTLIDWLALFLTMVQLRVVLLLTPVSVVALIVWERHVAMVAEITASIPILYIV